MHGAGIMAAVMNVAWPISTEYGEESRYNTLLQISIGQEEVDEVITRDIHRTFPEHPQFGFAQGQQALFRILKAYSLHDLEVCPCMLQHGGMFMDTPGCLRALSSDKHLTFRHSLHCACSCPGLCMMSQDLSESQR